MGIRWAAVLAGVVMSLGAEVLLNFLGVGLGFMSFSPDPDRALNIGIGAILWLAVTGIIAMVIGGLVIGKFSNIECKLTRALPGLVGWSLATLIVLASTTTTLGALIGGTSNIAQGVITVAGSSNLGGTDAKHLISSQMKPSQSDMDESKREEMSKAADEVSTNVGHAFVTMFIAFLLSAIASAVGAAYGYKNKVFK